MSLEHSKPHLYYLSQLERATFFFYEKIDKVWEKKIIESSVEILQMARHHIQTLLSYVFLHAGS